MAFHIPSTSFTRRILSLSGSRVWSIMATWPPIPPTHSRVGILLWRQARHFRVKGPRLPESSSRKLRLKLFILFQDLLGELPLESGEGARQALVRQGQDLDRQQASVARAIDGHGRDWHPRRHLHRGKERVQ